jgi:hypothetical protein
VRVVRLAGLDSLDKSEYPVNLTVSSLASLFCRADSFKGRAVEVAVSGINPKDVIFVKRVNVPSVPITVGMPSLHKYLLSLL